MQFPKDPFWAHFSFSSLSIGWGNTVRHYKIITYADDTVIYTSGKRKEDVEKTLQEDFTSLADLLELNNLIINLKKGKTECTLVGICQRVKNQLLDVNYRHYSISFTDTYKYLSVQLDQTLSLRSHLESTFKKAPGRLYLLKRVRFQLTTDAALSIYKSILLPLFTYRSILTQIHQEHTGRELTILKPELSESFTHWEIPTKTNSLFLSKNYK